jgi:hypothetical protein
VPTLKSTNNRNNKKGSVIDATEELIQLETAKSEGFTDIKITGSRLDMDSDFKTWVGIVRGLADFGDESGRVEMSITQFAKYCGYPSSRLRKTLREKVLNSLRKIMSATVSFQKTLETKNEDGSNKIVMKMVHLLNNVDYNEETGIISFEAEKRLKELYQFDHKVLLQLKVIQKLPRKEHKRCTRLLRACQPTPYPYPGASQSASELRQQEHLLTESACQEGNEDAGGTRLPVLLGNKEKPVSVFQHPSPQSEAEDRQ